MSCSSSIWDTIYANDVQTFCAFQEEMEQEQNNKGIGISGWTPSQPKGMQKFVGASPYALVSKTKEEIFCSKNGEDANGPSWSGSDFSDNDNGKSNNASSMSDELDPLDWENEVDLFNLKVDCHADLTTSTERKAPLYYLMADQKPLKRSRGCNDFPRMIVASQREYEWKKCTACCLKRLRTPW